MMHYTAPKLTFRQFLAFFPEVTLPVTLNEAALRTFEAANEPLPDSLTKQFLDLPGARDDALTEFVPCFSIPETHGFHAIVFWKAGLMKYEYFLVTFDLHGKLLSQAVIAGQRYEDGRLLRSVTTIEEDWKLHIVEGDQNLEQGLYDPKSSRAYVMELLATGEVIFLLSDSEFA